MLKMIIGSAWGNRFDFYEPDRSTPMTLTQRTVKVLIKKNKDDADESAILPIRTFQNVNVNYIIPTYSADETRQLKEGDYYFAIKIYTLDGLDREIYNDVLTIDKGVFND